jgi:hypothetical protein
LIIFPNRSTPPNKTHNDGPDPAKCAIGCSIAGLAFHRSIDRLPFCNIQEKKDLKNKVDEAVADCVRRCYGG